MRTNLRKIREKFGKKTKGEKKRKIKETGRPKKRIIFLWSLFLLAFLWSMYKNFTAVNTHTVHETKIVEQKIVDTNAVESFVIDFVYQYYTWENTQQSVTDRKARLTDFMTEELSRLGSIESGMSSGVKSMRILGVEMQNENQYKVLYVIEQETRRTEQTIEKELVEEPEMQEVIDEKTGKKTQESVMVQREIEKPLDREIVENHNSYFMVTVHMDEAGKMVIVQSPTIASVPEKSEYKPNSITGKANVDAAASKEITGFLENFFKLYPAANESAMEYYVKESVMPVVMQEYSFEEIIEKVFVKEDERVRAYLTVKYKDTRTELYQYSQYQLVLEKEKTWKIVGNDWTK